MTAGTKRRPELNRRPLRVIPYLRSLSVAGSPLVFSTFLSLLRKLPDLSLTTRPAAEYTQRTARVPSRLPALAGAVRVLATRKERQTISMRGWRSAPTCTSRLTVALSPLLRSKAKWEGQVVIPARAPGINQGAADG